MGISDLLEDFGALTRGRPVSLTDVSLEEQRLEAFEKGYQAGWDDSVKAASEDSRTIAADLAQNLSDLSFTYEEAQSAMLNALRPLLEQMMETVLPALMRGTLGAHVVDLVHNLARDLGPLPLEIVAAPENVVALDRALGEAPVLSVSVKEDPTLAEGQVFLRFGHEEREIDLSGLLASIERKMAGFFEEHRKDIA